MRIAAFVVMTAAFAGLGPALAACGGKNGKGPTVAVPSTDAGADASKPSSFATTPPPSGLPPMAAMPPPGVAGSKKAKVKDDGALAACGGKVPAHGKDPAALIKQVGEGCAAPAKMKVVGALMKGTQADKDPQQENKFHAEANHCYRVYFAGDDGIKDIVAQLKDGNGDIITESAGPSIPQSGSACFSQADDVTVMLGIGSGKGNWAAQAWGD